MIFVLPVATGTEVNVAGLGVGVWVGVDIVPSPDYALIAQACGAYGQRVEDPSKLQSALRNGLDQVHRGKPAIIDIRLESPYP